MAEACTIAGKGVSACSHCKELFVRETVTEAIAAMQQHVEETPACKAYDDSLPGLGALVGLWPEGSKWCYRCRTNYTPPALCDCTPAALTAEMLGEEDREAWEFAKGVLLEHRVRMNKRLTEVEGMVHEDIRWHYQHERDMAHKGVLLILRLLGSADAKGGE